MAVLRHGRRRTVPRPVSRDDPHDDDVTVETPAMTVGDRQLHGPHVDDLDRTTFGGDSSRPISTLLSIPSFISKC